MGEESLRQCIPDADVFQCGDPERTLPSIAFLDIYPSQCLTYQVGARTKDRLERLGNPVILQPKGASA